MRSTELYSPLSYSKHEAHEGLDRLVTGLFDYAGMFPPAALAYERALADAAQFKRTLARPHLLAAEAVLASADLERTTAEQLARSGFDAQGTELEASQLPAHGPAPGWVRIAVLGPASASDAREVAERNVRTAFERPAQRVVSYELKLDADRSVEDSARLLAEIAGALAGSGIRVFAEPQWTQERWLADGERLVDAIASLAGDQPRPGDQAEPGDQPEAGNQPEVEDGPTTCEGPIQSDRANGHSTPSLAGKPAKPVGLKVRGSGPTAIAPEALAIVIDAVARRALPFKATAGLHHPLREERYGNALGFLSLATALRLRQALGAAGMPREAIVRCLSASEPDDFDFSSGVRWLDRAIDLDQLEAACQAVPFSIGSCSLDEPDADLLRLFAPNTDR